MRTPGMRFDLRPSSQQTDRGHARPVAAKVGRGGAAAPWNSRDKSSQINALSGYDTILTWPDAVSMVRAAFEDDGGVISIHAASFRVSTWRAARTTAEMEVATNRRP